MRHDPVLAVLGGKLTAKRADCAPLAGKSTLNRRELSREEPTRYHKISYDAAAAEAVDLFLDAHSAPPPITLDLDATDDPLHEARHLYEKLYCARGEMENRIKERQLDLYADRTSAHTMRANQLRLWFASMVYVLIGALRRVGLKHTRFARASCGAIRLKLLKIGAPVRTSVRRIKLARPSAFRHQAEHRAAYAALTATTTA